VGAPYAEYVKSEDKQFIKDTLAEIRNPFELAIYGSENCWNFGAILRVGHNFMTTGYYSIDIPWYYKKAAMTARPWERERIVNCNIEEFLEKTKGRNIVAFERRSTLETEDIRTFKYPENPILLFGSEKFGVPDALLERADYVVSIPVMGLVYDHNVAVCAGIASYDWLSKHKA
jgi:tRNA G18 (ribose-2'-O)-methylase SpoU